MEDKQKLFRLIKRLAHPESTFDAVRIIQSIQPALPDNYAGDLLDLNEADENLIGLVRPHLKGTVACENIPSQI